MAFIFAAAAAAIALEGTLLVGSLALGAGESCEDTVASWLPAVVLGSEGVMSHFERRFFLGGSSSLNVHTKRNKKKVRKGLNEVLPTTYPIFSFFSAHVFKSV